MGTLYVDRVGTALDFDRGAMTMRDREGEVRSIPLRMIDRLVVVGNVHLTARLLIRLAEAGTGVVFMPGRRSSRGSFLHADGHGDVARRVGQYRLLEDPAGRAAWVRRLLWLRLAGQRRLLAAAALGRPDRRRSIVRTQATLQQIMCTVRGPTLPLARLRGCEGAASAAYFAAYRQLFPQSLGFTARRRRPPPDPVNAALSLGYTLVQGDALRAISAAGLEPLFGIIHEISHGRDSLACDLAELGRVRVERLVWRLFAEQRLRAESFAPTADGYRLRKAARSGFFAAYEGSAAVHRRWFERAARVFAAHCARLGRHQGWEGDAHG